jgi:type I restriction enzyme S subunit
MTKPWPVVKLGDVLTERRETPSLDAIFSGEISIVSKIGFDDGRIELRQETKTKTGMILIRPGDLVVSGINAAKGAIALYDKKNTKPIAATIHYAAYIPDEKKVNVHFLWLFLRSKSFQEILNQYLPAGIKTELRAERFLPIPIPLPPLSEQCQIVAKIEQLSIKAKDAHRLREHSSHQAAILLTSQLDKLTSQFRCLTSLGTILLEKPRNGWSVPCDNMDNGMPILTLSAVTGYQYKSSAYKRTSYPTNPTAHYWLKNGDLLMTRSNTPDLVGHAAIYSGIPSPCIYPDLMMRIPVDQNKALTRFVWYWLQTSLARKFISTRAKGTSPTMKKISQGIVMSIPFTEGLSLDEQRRIVAYVDDLQAKINKLKDLQNQTYAELDALLPSILDKAFKGQL